MRKNNAKYIALGGLLSAMAMVIMCLVGMIPFATFICPVLCIMLLSFVMSVSGSQIGWAWYGCVSILSLLLAPDKEAALIFTFLGYYPLIKPKLDPLKLRWLYKFLIFNIAIVLLYSVTIRLCGMDELLAELDQMGRVISIATLALGNLTFLLLDVALSRTAKLWRRK